MRSSYQTLTRHLSLVPLALACLLPGVSANAAEYVFTKIVDSSEGSSFYTPAINDLGVVAFRERTTDDERMIQSWNSGVTTTLYSSQNLPVLRGTGRVDINNSGIVAHNGQIASGIDGIYAGDGGPLTTIADETGEFRLFSSSQSISDSGRVVFHASLDDGGIGIFSGDGGPVTTVARTGDELDDLRVPEINDLDAIAYVASSEDDWFLFYQEVGQPRTTLLEELGNPDLFGFDETIGMNNIGDVVMSKTYFMPGTLAESVLLRVGPDGATIVADSTGPFWFFFDKGINESRDVAFLARLDDGRDGIFSGPDATNDRIVVEGDALFGGTVELVGFDVALNDHSQVAFWYRLDNGIEGIALATPVPEPTTLSFAILCLAGAFTYTRRSWH